MTYEDSKVVIDVREAEDGEIIYTGEDGKPKTYYPAYFVWMHVQTIEVVTFLGQPTEKGSEPPLATRVRGTAVLEDRSISVIGDPSSKSRNLNISFEAGDWRPPHEDDSNPLLSFRNDLGGASLGFNRADWEIGNSDEWWCACYLPDSFIKALVADIRDEQIHDLRVCLRLKRLYTTVHRYAPASMHGDLVIRPNLQTNDIKLPDAPLGWVDSIVFASCGLRLKGQQQPTEYGDEGRIEDTNSPDDQPQDQSVAALALIASSLQQFRLTIRWIGIVVAIALLILSAR